MPTPPIKDINSKYAEKSKTALVSPASGTTLAISEIEVQNRSGSSINLGWGRLLANAGWKAGQWDDSEASAKYEDDTTDAQESTANDFALTTTTNNDGFVVQALQRFHVVGITQGSTTEAGSPVYEYTYWDGSSWTALTLIDTPDFTSAADTYLSFHAPVDWAKGGDTNDNIDTDKYAIRVRATTAPSTAPLGTILWVVRLLQFEEAVPDNNSIIWSETGARGQSVLEGGEGIIPYFGTANASNGVVSRYRVYGETPA
tara:strand:- start:9028 stop:9801 length:774 start_codon:yes stop_codon:yes gene_type:complete